MIRHFHAACALACALTLAAGASGQSLLEQAAGQQTPQAAPVPASLSGTGTSGQPGQAQTTPPGAQPASGAPTYGQTPAQAGFSLFAVVTFKPRQWAKHDLVEIIINESNLQKFEQTQDLKKNSSLKAELAKFPSLRDLILDATLAEGIGTSKPGVGLTNDSKFKGEGKFNRKDQITAKITATVIDVKPNGNLVLEARETIQSDREVSTMVISGTCRSEDITKNNTIQSSQMAGMNLRIEHEGDVKDVSEKGLIPRVFEAIFNF